MAGLGDSFELAMNKYVIGVLTGKTQTSEKNKTAINNALAPYMPAPAPEPAPAPSPAQLAPVMDLVSTMMTPKQATGNSPTGGDGANKQAYGGDIATLRPVANAGDSSGTMLTGPTGVDPDALLLAKKTLLGA